MIGGYRPGSSTASYGEESETSSPPQSTSDGGEEEQEELSSGDEEVESSSGEEEDESSSDGATELSSGGEEGGEDREEESGSESVENSFNDPDDVEDSNSPRFEDDSSPGSLESHESDPDSTPLPPILNFQLTEQSADGNIEEYTSIATIEKQLLLYLDRFVYGNLGAELVAFLTSRYLERREVFRVWLGLTFEFIRPCLEGSQSIAAPFNQEVIYIAEATGIAADISESMSSLLEKIDLFISSGSGWSLVNFLHARADILYAAQAFNNIGHYRGSYRMFESNCSKHVGLEGTPILPKAIFGLCDDKSQCFPLSMGASLYTANLPQNTSQLSQAETDALKEHLLHLAYTTYDFSMITNLPCSFEMIKKFIKANEGKVAISMIGLSRTKQNKTKKGRPYNYKAWPVFQSPKFLQAVLAETLPIVYLVVTSESECSNSPSLYHVALMLDFQQLMQVVKRGTPHRYFCPTCFGIVEPNRLQDHANRCHNLSGQGAAFTHMEFNRLTYQERFKMEVKNTPPGVLGCFDLETAREKNPNRGILGPLTDAEFKLKAIAYAGLVSIDLNVEGLPKLLPKSYVGINALGAFFEQMAFEVLYLQTVLRSTVYPIHMTEEQRQARFEVTHCGGCGKKFESSLDIIAHHRHSKPVDNFLGYVCRFCNGKARKIEPAVILAYNLAGFEGIFGVGAARDATSRTLVERMRLFCKANDRISSMRVQLRCLLCSPDLLPKKRLPYRTFGLNAASMEVDLDQEFEIMSQAIRQRIEEEEALIAAEAAAAAGQLPLDNRTGASHEEEGLMEDSQRRGDGTESFYGCPSYAASENDSFDNEDGFTDDDDDDDDDDDEEETDSVDEREQISSSILKPKQGKNPESRSQEIEGKLNKHFEPIVPDWTASRGYMNAGCYKTCRHHPLERTLVLKDSLNFSNTSLDKAVSASKTCFKKTVCEDPNSDFYVSSEPKNCDCCTELMDLRVVGGALCDFSERFFGSMDHATTFFRKLPFPYKKLDALLGPDGQIDEQVLLEPIPSKEFFENDLADPKSLKDMPGGMSENAYQEFLQMTEAMHLNSFGALLSAYNLSDIVLTLLITKVIQGFFFKTFGLSILRFSSLSGFAFNLLLKGMVNQNGEIEGVETLKNLEQKTFLQRATYGGFSTHAYAGGTPRFANSVELPNFSPTARQRHIIPVDSNSMYPSVFVTGRGGNLPQCNYELHETGSKLIKDMNAKLLQEGGLEMANFYNEDSEKRNITYLMEVEISYPLEAQIKLFDLPPTVCRRVISMDALSEAQRAYAARFLISPNTAKPVVSHDFLPQTTTVSVAYLVLLARLGVKIDGVVGAMTAFEKPIFRETMEKLLALKARAETPYFRQLAKMW